MYLCYGGLKGKVRSLVPQLGWMFPLMSGPVTIHAFSRSSLGIQFDTAGAPDRETPGIAPGVRSYGVIKDHLCYLIRLLNVKIVLT